MVMVHFRQLISQGSILDPFRVIESHSDQVQVFGRQWAGPHLIFQDKQLHHRIVHGKVDIQLLIRYPLADGLGTRLFKSAAVGLPDDGIVFADAAVGSITSQGPRKGVDSAGGGSGRIYAAALGGHEGTLLVGIVAKAQGSHRKSGGRPRVNHGISVYEFLAGDIQMAFEAQHVIRGQGLVEILATMVKAWHLAMAGKAEGLLRFNGDQVGGLHRKLASFEQRSINASILRTNSQILQPSTLPVTRTNTISCKKSDVNFHMLKSIFQADWYRFFRRLRSPKNIDKGLPGWYSIYLGL
jgi:hypothetical protein